MRLVMFTPREARLPRGWPGRCDGDTVVQLAAQTLQAFFTGGSSAREHARFPLDEVDLLAPVLNPPSIRVFDGPESFAFANPAAICPPGATVDLPGRLDVAVRVVGVIGAEEQLAGWTLMAEWRAPELPAPKDRDFSLVLGPAVETAYDDAFRWEAARAHAARNTRLRPGDLLAGPVVHLREDVQPGETVELEVAGLGTLQTARAPR
jgi:hypothetical protein